MIKNLRLSLIVFIILNLAMLSIRVDANTVVEMTKKEVKVYVKQLGEQCWAQRVQNSQEAIKLGKKALKYAKDYELNDEIARISNFMGVIYIHFLYNAKSGISYLHQALEISLFEKDSVQLAYAYNNLGDAYLLSGNTPLALQYAENSLQLFEEINDSVGIAYSYINLGAVYRKEGNYEIAIFYFEKSKSLRELRDDELGVAAVLLELAKTYHRRGDLERALSIYQESYAHQLATKNVLFTAFCLNLMAQIYEEQGHIETATEYYLNAIELLKEKQHLSGLLDSYLGLSLVYAKQKSLIKGEEMLSISLQIAEKIGLATKVLKTYEYYTKFYQLLGKYKEASEKSEQFLVLYDSILSSQQFETFYELQKNYTNEFNLKLARQELESSRLKEKYLLVIVVLMIVLMIGAIWRVRTNRKMNQHLKQINQAKDKLFSVISHDLKNPFNSLLGFSEVMIDEINNHEYENVRKYAEIINQSAEESLKLLTNLLNWSRSQTGQIKYVAEELMLNELFDELKGFFKSDATHNQIALDFNSMISNPIIADSNILRIILINLVSNALKYTSAEGKIEISAKIKLDRIFIEIKDNGTGMSVETRITLFNEKQTKSIDGLRKEKGTGLGLKICSELIKLHHGHINVLSELGIGSTFIISFPKE